ncbi:hypothetical protein [Flavobacterium rhizosphaerae]|uniref:Uncharacterized protein n=1 Tax=Flavobacterium rhizosphaerae TaxID=3163298 RepID=A0ABW8YWZ2_9FLAO
MPISNYTTKIPTHKTISEIQQMLAAHGAQKIMVEYKDKDPSDITFQIDTAKGNISFRLPANWQGVLNAMGKDEKVPRALRKKDQAQRVSWRIIRDWVEAQTAIIQAELASIDQVFLPYALTKGGKTVYDSINDKNFLMLE